MKVKNITQRFVAVCTFALGVGAVVLWSNLSQLDNSQKVSAEVIGILEPTREVSHISEDRRIPTLSDNLMMLFPSQRASLFTPQKSTGENLIEHNCATLVITVDRSRRVSLNGEELGTLKNFSDVTSRVKGIFRDRTRMLVYQSGMEQRFDLPLEDRIYKTVLIEPAPELSYAEVVRVIELVKGTGARPVALSLRP
jgi:biopolymer transport protein ExbD